MHNGHVDIATRASKVFSRLVIGVYDDTEGDRMFSVQERVKLCEESTSKLQNVEVLSFRGLTTSFARAQGAEFIVRGLRAGFDFELEFGMALMWRNLARDIDVVCMMSALEYQFIYSSRIKEVARLGGEIDGLVPPPVAAALRERSSSPG